MKLKALGIDEDKIESHPARGAWIEIQGGQMSSSKPIVAPRKGCVD